MGVASGSLKYYTTSFFLRRECERRAGAKLGFRPAVHPCLAHAEIEREVVADLPDEADQPGKRFFEVEFALVTDFRHGTHGPIIGAFNDRPNEHIVMLLARQGNAGIEVDRAPGPA